MSRETNLCEIDHLYLVKILGLFLLQTKMSSILREEGFIWLYCRYVFFRLKHQNGLDITDQTTIVRNPRVTSYDNT